MITPTLLKALQVFATECKYGTTLIGNRRGLSERKKLDLAKYGYIEMSAGNAGLYVLSEKGRETLKWAATPILATK